MDRFLIPSNDMATDIRAMAVFYRYLGFNFFGQVFIKDKKTFVCLKCGETSQKSGDICECGGLRIDLNEAKWVDDPSDEGYEPAECVKCGAPISDKESKCPKCGWTWIVPGENVPDIEKRFFTDK